MPRGVPNAKRDEVPLRFTTFNIPPQMNQKQGGSHYLKNEEQTLWGRSKKLAKSAAEASGASSEARRGSNVIVIHPGTRFLRVGRASDVFPVEVPHVIARKSKVPVSKPLHVSCVAGRSHQKDAVDSGEGDTMNVDRVPRELWDPTDPKTSPIASSLRERMIFYKLNIVPKATEACTGFNNKVQAEVIPDHNDPYRLEWLDGDITDDVLIGEKALRLADPQRLGYTVRWPLHGSRFNSFDYAHAGQHALVNDIEAIWTSVLQNRLDISPKTFKDFAVILIVPDLFERQYVRELVNILLTQMGFKQVCVKQESISATYGAGMSNACVIDAGAAKTSIAIVDDGLVLPDTRICLNMGGDDITEFLLALLERIHFPYREANLSRSYDWELIEDLKGKICTLAEFDVAMNVYDVVVRRPGKQAEKYVFRAYNETILAPMCMFEPRVIEFERKQVYMHSLWDRDVGEEIVEQANDQITQAMIISTQHLLPPPIPAVIAPPPVAPTTFTSTSTFPVMDPAVAEGYGRPVFSVAPQTAQATAEGPTIGQFAGRTQSKFISLDARDFEAPVQGSASWSSAVKETRVQPEVVAATGVVAVGTTAAAAAATVIAAAPSTGQAGGGEQQEQRRVQPEPQPDVSGQVVVPPPPPPPVYPLPGTYPGGFGIDVAFEAGKLPLDVAIFNSARAAGGDEKIRKYLQAVLVVGGSALVPGMAHALESRLQAIATPLVLNMEKVQIIPPPREVDPRVLCWKGGAAIGKMEAVADLWVTRHDWDVLGMRSLKERSFFL